MQIEEAQEILDSYLARLVPVGILKLWDRIVMPNESTSRTISVIHCGVDKNHKEIIYVACVGSNTAWHLLYPNDLVELAPDW